MRLSVKDLLSRGGRLIYASGADMGVKGIKIDYYFGFDHIEKGRHTILRTYLDRENASFKSITPITMQADWSERELIEFLGIKMEEHPDPRHLWLPLNWEDMYISGKPEADETTERVKTEHPAEVKDNIVPLQTTRRSFKATI
jgi:Ni,Fe-hydrogenase III component G